MTDCSHIALVGQNLFCYFFWQEVWFLFLISKGRNFFRKRIRYFCSLSLSLFVNVIILAKDEPSFGGVLRNVVL